MESVGRLLFPRRFQSSFLFWTPKVAPNIRAISQHFERPSYLLSTSSKFKNFSVPLFKWNIIDGVSTNANSTRRSVRYFSTGEQLQQPSFVETNQSNVDYDYLMKKFQSYEQTLDVDAAVANFEEIKSKGLKLTAHTYFTLLKILTPAKNFALIDKYLEEAKSSNIENIHIAYNTVIDCLGSGEKNKIWHYYKKMENLNIHIGNKTCQTIMMSLINPPNLDKLEIFLNNLNQSNQTSVLNIILSNLTSWQCYPNLNRLNENYLKKLNFHKLDLVELTSILDYFSTMNDAETSIQLINILAKFPDKVSSIKIAKAYLGLQRYYELFQFYENLKQTNPDFLDIQIFDIIARALIHAEVPPKQIFSFVEDLMASEQPLDQRLAFNVIMLLAQRPETSKSVSTVLLWTFRYLENRSIASHVLKVFLRDGKKELFLELANDLFKFNSVNIFRFRVILQGYIKFNEGNLFDEALHKYLNFRRKGLDLPTLVTLMEGQAHFNHFLKLEKTWKTIVNQQFEISAGAMNTVLSAINKSELPKSVQTTLTDLKQIVSTFPNGTILETNVQESISQLFNEIVQLNA